MRAGRPRRPPSSPEVLSRSSASAFTPAPRGCARTPGRAPRALARLAEAAWRDGAAVDAALALPVYLRDKVAQTTAERDAARAASLAAAATP